MVYIAYLIAVYIDNKYRARSKTRVKNNNNALNLSTNCTMFKEHNYNRRSKVIQIVKKEEVFARSDLHTQT